MIGRLRKKVPPHNGIRLLYLILRREAKRSLEGGMADTGSSFEALLRKAPQDEVVGFHTPYCMRNSNKLSCFSPVASWV